MVLHVVGARPNFMKAAPAIAALARRSIAQRLVHTGQHYDRNMSDVFFQELGIPEPDINLGVGSGSHTVQTAQIMMGFEKTVLEEKPDMVMVYGDINSTVAAALVCSKLGVRIAHVEAGLRSRDRSMPEEINRLVVDQLADLLFTPSRDGDENLKREGVAPEKIHLVGNLMIDTLVRQLRHAVKPDIEAAKSKYVLVTLHRPSNVDEPVMLRQIVDSLDKVSKDVSVVFPIHPRTRQRLASINYRPATGNLHFIEPLGYLAFLALQRDAVAVVTDSGGIQEETTYLGVPCLTVRKNTERPITVDVGTNILVGQDMDQLKIELEKILSGKGKRGQIPSLWDGRAAERLADVVCQLPLH